MKILLTRFICISTLVIWSTSYFLQCYGSEFFGEMVVINAFILAMSRFVLEPCGTLFFPTLRKEIWIVFTYFLAGCLMIFGLISLLEIRPCVGEAEQAIKNGVHFTSWIESYFQCAIVKEVNLLFSKNT